jgi:hypothetical protein
MTQHSNSKAFKEHYVRHVTHACLGELLQIPRAQISRRLHCGIVALVCNGHRDVKGASRLKDTGNHKPFQLQVNNYYRVRICFSFPISSVCAHKS